MFTIGFSVIFLIMLGATNGTQTISYLDNITNDQYYVPGFIAYGIMAACFSMLTSNLVTRRETGLLKRLRLTPLPAWALLSAIFLSTAIVALVRRRCYWSSVVSVTAWPFLARGWRSSSWSCGYRVFYRHGRRHQFGDPEPGDRRTGDERRLFCPALLVGLWFPLPPHSVWRRFPRSFRSATFSPRCAPL